MAILTIEVTDEEMAAIHQFTPMLDAIKNVLPSALLTVVHKVENAIKEL